MEQQAVILDQNQVLREEYAQPEQPSQSHRMSKLFSVFLDSLSFAFFCMSFSCLMRMLPAWCYRFLAEE